MAAQRASPLVVCGTYWMLYPTYTSAVLYTPLCSFAKPWLNPYPNFRLCVPQKFLKYARSWLKLYRFQMSKAVCEFPPMLLHPVAFTYCEGNAVPFNALVVASAGADRKSAV